MGLFDAFRSRAQSNPQMPSFDMHAATLCSQHYKPGPDPGTTLLYGALGAFLHTLRDADTGKINAKEMLAEHGETDGNAKALVEVARALAEDTVSQSWPTFVAQAAKSRIPLAGAIIMTMIDIVEGEHPRPPGQLHPGHFALMIDYAAAYALSIALIAPEKARVLMKDNS